MDKVSFFLAEHLADEIQQWLFDSLPHVPTSTEMLARILHHMDVYGIRMTQSPVTQPA